VDSSLDRPEGESDQPAEEPEEEDDEEEPLHEEPTAAEIMQASFHFSKVRCGEDQS